MKKLSLVVSCYNEEAVLEKFYTAFAAFKSQILWDYELIFVNDGSSDRSLEILRDISKRDDKIKVISFSRNFGHEAAMISGMDYCSGDGIICMDADLQHPLECIPDIIRKLEEGYEVISMVRLENKSAGLIKKITSKGFYKVINLLSSQAKFEENASDFFAISRRVVDVLKNNYREKSRFLRGYVQSVGYKKTTLEYVAAERAGGQSHYSIKKLIRFSISTIVAFSDLPLKLGIYTGIVSAIMGVITLIYTIYTKNSHFGGQGFVLVLLWLLFAVLFVLIGIIGEYLSIIYAEIKDRPIYLIEEKINFDVEDSH